MHLKVNAFLENHYLLFTVQNRDNRIGYSRLSPIEGFTC